MQGICREVDSRREDVKWLVQTLDALTATRADNESVYEQQQLEKLIARYKNLIPSIEMTVVRTELYSKCYVYSKEVKEVRQMRGARQYIRSQVSFIMACDVARVPVAGVQLAAEGGGERARA